ncbi:MAG: Ribosome-binding factor A [Candidatus Kapaibacterium sp.]|nr:MAG: Ribosome-binding factor A [Candidatus Kapabacteria bacterium]
MSVRSERVASEIQKVLSEPISEFARQNNAGLATITNVRMSPDLQYAYIYISVYGGKISPQTFINLVEQEKSTFRQIVGSKVRLRLTPELRFFVDDTFERIERIEQILASEKKAREAKDKNGEAN